MYFATEEEKRVTKGKEWMKGNQLTSVPELSALSELEELYLNNNELQALLTEIAQLPHLRISQRKATTSNTYQKNLPVFLHQEFSKGRCST